VLDPTTTTDPAGRTTPDPAIAIDVQDLHKRYEDTVALDGLTFQVGVGEFFGILGPNGAGKTTTLEIMEGIRQADRGEVTVLGERPWPRNRALLPRIGVQLQGSAFIEKLTAREQIETFAGLYGVPRRRAHEMLDVVGLAGRAKVFEDKLSGGERQRLSIACALVHDPALLFLDEPTASLDPQARRNLWDLLREIQSRGKTIVYTTHSIDEAEALCDRVAIVDHGRLLALDTPRSLVRELDAATRVRLPRLVLGVDAARALPGVESVDEDGPDVIISTRSPAQVVAALAANDRLDGVSLRPATLEDVFLELTGRAYRE
jgi:ABC-2 type transport system ATP-binding protein